MNKFKVFIIVIVGQAFFTNCAINNKFIVWTNEEPVDNSYQSFSVFKKNNKVMQDTFELEMESALRYQMQLRGFKYKEHNPDLLLIPQIVSHVPFRKKNTNQKTLGIKIVNNRDMIQEWEGWVTIQEDQGFTSERDLKRGIMLIFDNYKVFARGFLINNNSLSKNVRGKEIVIR